MTIEALAASDGAFTIGGGEWNYGQNMTEELGKSLFMLPELTPENVLTVLRLALERLPLDALKGFQGAFGLAEELFNDAGSAITAILGALATKPIKQTVDAFNTWVSTTFSPMNTMFNQIVDVLRGLVVTPINAAVSEVIDWVNGLSEGGLSEVLTQFQTFLGTITNLSTWLDVLKGVIDFFGTITSRTTWLAVFKEVVDFFNTITSRTAWLAVFKNVVDTFQTLFNSLGAGVWTVIAGVVTTFNALLTALGTSIWTVLTEIITHFAGLFTGAGTVSTWLQGVLTTLSKLPAWNLVGQIPAAVMGVLNIGHLTTDPVNLLLHPTLEDATTVSAVDGWSWDSTQNASGTGGSAKVTLDGFNKELSHQTSVQVAPGDKMNLSASVKTSGVTGTGWKVAVTVMEYRNGAIATPVEIASRTTAASSWVNIVGDYVVPANVTSVVFRLVVENATAGTVWFDNLDMHKSGVLEQGWVENLPNTWENMYAGLVGDGATGIGKTWADMGTASESVRQRGVLARGAADAANSSHLLNWNYLFDAHNGNPINTSFGKDASSLYTAASGHRGVTSGTLNNLWDAFNGSSGTSGISPENLLTKASVTQGAVNTATANHTLMFNNLVDAFTGATASTGKTAADVKSAATAVKTTQNNANTAVFGTTAPTSTTKIKQAALPTTVAAVGSGILCTRTTAGIYAVNWQPNRTAVSNLPFGFYNNASVNTDDLIRESFGGNESVRAVNAGWYQVEVCYKLYEEVQYTYWWSFTPAIYESRTAVYKYGTSVISSRDTWATGTFSYSPSSAQSSFIVYMNAGDRVIPGYNTNKEYNGSGSNSIIGPCSASNTYFSVALLNRSLA